MRGRKKKRVEREKEREEEKERKTRKEGRLDGGTSKCAKFGRKIIMRYKIF